MNLNFSAHAHVVWQYAEEEATRHASATIGAEHILLALIRDDAGIGGQVLRDAGADGEKARQVVNQLFNFKPRRTLGYEHGELAGSAKRVLEVAMQNALGGEIGTKHLLLGVIEQAQTLKILGRLGINPIALRQAVESQSDSSNSEATGFVHVVMFKLKDGSAENITATANKLRTLAQQISATITIGEDVSRGAISYDLILNAQFESEADYHAYTQHPARQAIVNHMHTVAAEAVIINYHG